MGKNVSNEDFEKIKSELLEHMEKVNSIDIEGISDLNTEKRVILNNLRYHLTFAFNKINEILDIGGL